MDWGTYFALSKVFGGSGGGGTTIEPLSVTENGTYTAPSGSAYSPVTVSVSGGSSDVPASYVNFYDYDGTIVQSYTADEFAQLTAMPENPSHSGLIAQGWNWSLNNAKAYVAKYGHLEIGQTYTTDDGKTRLYIHIDDDITSSRMTFYVRFSATVVGGVTIDWGDGNTETNNTTEATNYPHTYTNPGDYIITLNATNGTIAFTTSYDTAIYGPGGNTHIYNARRIIAVEIGDNVTSIGDSAFRLCHCLNTITIPSSVTNIGASVFYLCVSLKHVTIPNSVTDIGNSIFAQCGSLICVSISESVTNIGTSTFQGCTTLRRANLPDHISLIPQATYQSCRSLFYFIVPNDVISINSYAAASVASTEHIIIPSGVTSIGANAFSSCYGVSDYHIRPTTPPTLDNINAFSNIVPDCIIYVPYSEDHSILNAYKTATNWSTYASYMQEEPQ